MDRNVVKLGGSAALGMAICYVLISMTYFLVPAEQLKGFSQDFWPSFVQGHAWRVVFQFAQAIGAALGVAVVLGVREYSEKRNEAWLGWTSVLAYVGFSLAIIDNVRSFQIERLQSVIYMAGDPAVKAGILANTAIYNLDAMGVLGFGAVAFWLAVACMTLVEAKKIPQGLSWLGYLSSVLMVFVVVGYATQNTLFLGIAAGLGGFVTVPVFFVWLGMKLREIGGQSTSSPKPAKRKR